MTPEQQVRKAIDGTITAADWSVQDRAALDLPAARALAIRYLAFSTSLFECNHSNE